MKINKKIKHFEKEIVMDFDETLNYLREPKHIKILKIIVILIAISIIGFLIYNNLLISHEFNYFYDIGGAGDIKNSYLSPASRVSDIMVERDVNYRNLTGHLVYFIVKIPKGIRNLKIETRFKNNFPNKTKFFIGAKNGNEWSYKYNEVYDTKPTSTGFREWSIKGTEFNIKEDELFVKNGKLSMFLNAEHLREDLIETNTNYIPIDYINITIYKPGMIEKIKEGTPFWQALKEVMS